MTKSRSTFSEISSFAAVVPQSAKLLILGSMPGVRSLDQRQYYAHPRNAFWAIIADLLETPLPENYSERLQMLSDAGIALWDVLRCCRRPGSLDSAIEQGSEQPNNIPELLRLNPGIALVATNGGKASTLFKSFFASQLPPTLMHIELPSTSPANARMSFNAKLQCWKKHLAPHIAWAD